MKSTLVLDMSNLAYRSFHALKGKPTIKHPVVYGILRDMGVISRHIQSVNFVFCFDSDHYLRRKALPEYKPARVDKKDLSESPNSRSEVLESLDWLREEILPEIGYGNVLQMPGAEADDLMAMVCGYEGKFWLVTSDQDVYQLLQEARVYIWDPRTKKPVTHWNITRDELVRPGEWVMYKAIMGCKSDGIPGIPGIGKSKAASYIRKTCKKGGPVEKTVEDNWTIVERNIKLIQLPYSELGGEVPVLVSDDIQSGAWDEVMAKYGLESLTGKVPCV